MANIHHLILFENGSLTRGGGGHTMQCPIRKKGQKDSGHKTLHRLHKIGHHDRP